MLEFSSVLPWWPGDGEDLEEVGDTLGESDSPSDCEKDNDRIYSLGKRV